MNFCELVELRMGSGSSNHCCQLFMSKENCCSRCNAGVLTADECSASKSESVLIEIDEEPQLRNSIGLWVFLIILLMRTCSRCRNVPCCLHSLIRNLKSALRLKVTGFPRIIIRHLERESITFKRCKGKYRQSPKVITATIFKIYL